MEGNSFLLEVMIFSLCIINRIWWYYNGSKTLVGLGLLMVEFSRSHTALGGAPPDGDQPFTETST